MRIVIENCFSLFGKEKVLFPDEIKRNINMRKFFKLTTAFFCILLLTFLGMTVYYNTVLPNNYYITSGSELKISEFIAAVPCTGKYSAESVIPAGQTNSRRMELKLLGIIPIKTVNIQEVKEPVLVPCGNPFGIKLLTDGVIVVEVSSFETASGLKAPAMDAGIRAGDIIKTINGNKITSNDDIADIIEKSGGEKLTVSLVRNDSGIIVNVTPRICKTDDSYRIGLWVRDSSAGIGTVTFYDPETGVFAGLGHPVCDIDT